MWILESELREETQASDRLKQMEHIIDQLAGKECAVLACLEPADRREPLNG